MEMQDKIFQILVPMVEETEHKNGKKSNVLRKIFPGYVLVEMLLDDASWSVVRNTPGVTGFVGSSGSGAKPIPLLPEEVDNIMGRVEKRTPARVIVDFSPGESVQIIDGPFFDLVGCIDEIDLDRARMKVFVNIFGRDTPVELDFVQVKKV